MRKRSLKVVEDVSNVLSGCANSTRGSCAGRVRRVAARFALRPVEHDAVNAKRRDGPARNLVQIVIAGDRTDQRRRRA